MYSQDENTPELILTITKPDGTELTTLDERRGKLLIALLPTSYLYAVFGTSCKDALFATDPGVWTTKLGSYSVSSKVWLHLGSDEWTISRRSDIQGQGYYVRAKTASYTYGTVSNKGVSTSYAVRPTFSLLSSVTYASGDGTLNSPIRINW